MPRGAGGRGAEEEADASESSVLPLLWGAGCSGGLWGGGFGIKSGHFSHFFCLSAFLPLWLGVGVVGCCPTAALRGREGAGGHRVPPLSHPLQVSGARPGNTRAGCLYLAPA